MDKREAVIHAGRERDTVGSLSLESLLCKADSPASGVVIDVRTRDQS